jgi:hypothetical protein
MPRMDLTPEEARHIIKRRRSERRDEFFQAGLNAAANLVLLRWRTIQTAEDANTVADEIIGLRRPRNTKQKGS